VTYDAIGEGKLDVKSTVTREINHYIQLGYFSRSLELLERRKSSIPLMVYKQKVKEIKELLRDSSQPVSNVDVYVYVQHTASYPSNSGIQRVVRQLIKHLLLIPTLRLQCIALDFSTRSITDISHQEAFNLSEWNGPHLHDLQIRHLSFRPSIVIIPELVYTSFYPVDSSMAVFDAFRKNNLKIVSIFYDNIPFVVSSYKETSAIHADYVDTVLTSDCIVPISSWVARDLLDYSVHIRSLPEISTRRKIHPLLLGYTHMHPDSRGEDYRKTGLSRNGYILSVGTIAPHKNQLQLITAFQLFLCQNPNSRLKLVLAGNIASELTDFVLAQQSNDIMFVKMPSDEFLHDLYNNCKMVCFPSGEEGYGLPIIEAIGYGKPVIAANFGAMVEVSESIGIGCLSVNTLNTVELAQAIAKLDNDNTALGTEHEIQAKSQITSWNQYANEFSTLITKLFNQQQARKILFDASCLIHQRAAHSDCSAIQLGILKGLLDLGHASSIVLVKNCKDQVSLAQLSPCELASISSTLGIRLQLADFSFGQIESYQDSIYINPSNIDSLDSDWFFEKAASIISFLKAFQIKSCAIFFEQSPSLRQETKLSRDLKYCDYLKLLSLHDYVFPESYEAEKDLREGWDLCSIDSSTSNALVKTVYLATENLDKLVGSCVEFLNSDESIVSQLKSVDKLLRHKLVFCYFSSAENDSAMMNVAQAFDSLPFHLRIRAALLLVGRQLDASCSKTISDSVDNKSIFFVDNDDDLAVQWAFNCSSVSILTSAVSDCGISLSACLRRNIPVLMPYCYAMKEAWRHGSGFYLIAGDNVREFRDAMASMIDNPTAVDRLKAQTKNYKDTKWHEYVDTLLSEMDVDAFAPTYLFSQEVRDIDSFRYRNINLTF
jgi:glycosyltransferase involved in cell wall biosynthesis